MDLVIPMAKFAVLFEAWIMPAIWPPGITIGANC